MYNAPLETSTVMLRVLVTTEQQDELSPDLGSLLQLGLVTQGGHREDPAHAPLEFACAGHHRRHVSRLRP